MNCGFLITLHAKHGKEKQAEEFLSSAFGLVNDEKDILTWHAMKLTLSKYLLFVTFANELSRDKHWKGKVAKVLFDNAPNLFIGQPHVKEINVLSFKTL